MATYWPPSKAAHMVAVGGKMYKMSIYKGEKDLGAWMRRWGFRFEGERLRLKGVGRGLTFARS